MLEDLAKEIRKEIMLTACCGNTGHLASSFSAVEIMTALYFGDILCYDKEDPYWEDRDKVIISKGHATLVLYSVLKHIGYITQEQMETFCQPGSEFGGEAKYGDIPGIEATTGSLGHGLSFAVGIAMANKLDKRKSRVYALLGDGECQEGSVWEAVLSAAHHRLDNLTVILDRNQLQAMGDTEEIVGIDPMDKKWEDFGWHVTEVNGHDIKALIEVFRSDKELQEEKPHLIIADTIKGKGVSFMENVPIWHYRMPNEEEMEIVKKELDISEEEIDHAKYIFERSI